MKDLDNNYNETNKEELMKRIEKSQIKITVDNHTNGTGKGFLCKLYHPKLSNLCSFIITNHHVINYDNIKNDMEITILDNNKSYKIKKDDSRKKYINESLDITVIEILKKDNININSFLEIDDKFYGDIPSRSSYINNLIYSFQNPNVDKSLNLCKGIIYKINEKSFVYSFNSHLSPGSLIFCSFNHKVLGIHKSNTKESYGIFFNEIMEEFLKKNFNINKIEKKSKDKSKKKDKFKTKIKKSQLFNSNENIDINEYYLICPKCKLVPFFNLCNKLYIKCNCEEVKKDFNYFCDNYIIEKNEENELNISKEFLKCLKHKKKYKYYCEKCEENLCSKCFLENDHHEHKKIIFDTFVFDTNIKIEKIQDILKEYFENKKKNNLLLKNLVKIIINQYEEDYFCYNIFKNIDNIHLILSKRNKNDGNDNNNKCNAESIKTYCMVNENIQDISYLMKKNLNNLEILELQKNNISDLSSLKNVNFVNLRHFNLSDNRIDNINIAYLQGFNFKKLVYFNICSNNLNNFAFFEKVNSFQKLRKLYISSNKFNDDIEQLKNNIYNLSHIEEIDLSDGVFSDKSIELLKNFEFDNLKGLFLSYNHLSSLSFIKDLNCPMLSEIYLDNNNLCEFEPLIKFTNIKIIQINNNKIKDINNLKNFVNELKQLKKLSIKGNKLEKKNDNIINEIKKEGKIKIYYKNTDF